MTALTTVQVADYARAAGFTGTSLVTAVAIAHAESGFRPEAVGDVNLTEPGEQSTGLWQINWRPSRDSPGGMRDPTKNLDPAFNARAAWAISGLGRSFRPWSTFTSGAYKQFLAEAQAAADAPPVPEPPKGPPVAQSSIVTAFAAPDGLGYWIVFSDGAIHAYGSARYFGRPTLDANSNWQPVYPT